MSVHKRKGVALVIVAGSVCAGLLWASQALADFAYRPAGSRAEIAGGVQANARAATRPAFALRPALVQRPSSAWANAPVSTRYQASAAVPSTSLASLIDESYRLTAPEYLSDPAASYARSIAVGEVSGDGRDDLVFLSLRSASNPAEQLMEVYVALQGADGRLAPAVKITDSNHALAVQLLVADLNHDGVGEIITTIVNGVMVLRSNADGTFTRSTVAVSDPYDLLVTDVNRDGHPDILVDSSDTSATVLHGDGLGGIAATSELPLPSSAVRTTGDLTGDGLDDLVLATIVARPLEEFHIYRALATGGYAAPLVMSRPPGSHHADSLAVGDFNLDGRADLAWDESKNAANVHIYFQDAQGNLVNTLDLPRITASGPMIATDLNGDGRTDIAIAHTGWGYVGFYLQTPSGLASEVTVQAYQHSGRKNFFATGDLNHDGCTDLIVSRWSQSPAVLYGQDCFRPQVTGGGLPPARVPGSASQASPLLSPPARPYRNDLRSSGNQVLTRGAAARFGHDVRR